MAYLEEIPEYKSDLLHALVDNENIVTYIGNKSEDIYDSADLVGINIFPYPYIPDTQTEVLTYITLDIYVPRVRDKLIKDIQIVINIFSHKDMSRHKGKSRVDLLCIEVDKILNGSKNFGIDSVDLVSVLPYLPNNKYAGKQMIYNVQNLNQRRCMYGDH